MILSTHTKVCIKRWSLPSVGCMHTQFYLIFLRLCLTSQKRGMLLVTTQTTTRLTYPRARTWIIYSKQKALQTLMKNISAELLKQKYNSGKAIKAPSENWIQCSEHYLTLKKKGKGHAGALQGKNVDGKSGGGMAYSHYKEERRLQQTPQLKGKTNKQKKRKWKTPGKSQVEKVKSPW